MVLPRQLSTCFKRIGLPVGIAAALTFGLSWSAAADYRLHAGDVIEIAVAGLPQLGQRAPVQLDGSIAIPGIGTLDVEGMTLADVRERIRSAFTSRLLTVYTSDGRELTRTVEREDVSAAIAQYAPIWVSGDVVKSGEQTFQPRMTVRQAIASAGGLRSYIMDTDTSQRYDPIGLKSEYIASWLALAGHAARVWRLRTELGGVTEFDRTTIPPAPVPEDVLTRILAIEKQVRRLRHEDSERERAFLERSVSLAEEQIKSLSERIELEKQGELDDTQEYERLQELLGKGHATSVRVADARRALLYSSTRRLQTADALMETRRQLDQSRRSLEKLDDQHRLTVHEGLQAAESKMVEEHARLQTLQAKLNLAGIAVPRHAGQQVSPLITIIRRIDMKPVAFEAGLDDEIEPRDIVEVAASRQSAASDHLGATGIDRPRFAQGTK